MEFTLSALPFLFLLACPLMMIICFVGMRKAEPSPSTATAQDTSGQPREVRVAALEGQLAKIQALQATKDARPVPESSLSGSRFRDDRQPEVDHAARQLA